MSRLQQGLAAVALAHPDRVAVRDPDGTDLTYAQLHAAAADLARRLPDPPVPPPDRVLCVLAPRSAFAATAAVAAASAGFAVCFANPAWPAPVRTERAQWAQVVVDGRQARYDRSAAAFTGWDHAAQDTAPTRPGAWADPPVTPGAFAVTTSGSTGRPRTVVARAGPLLRLVRDACAVTGIPAGATWSWSHELSFDFAMWEMWGALLTGGRLVVAGDAVVREPRGLLALAEQERVQVLSITPRHLEELCLAYEPAAYFPDRTIVGGDLFSDSVAAALPPGPAAFNLYGISEGGIHTTCHRLTPADRQGTGGRPSVPVGSALPGRRVRLVDAAGLDVPAGAGELLVEGDGVAYGYLGDPAATAERFYPDASGRPGLRTGDTGWRDDDGRLYVTGRLDRQLKIRGMRVDPSEVESRLTRHPAIGSALVGACPGGLHGYVTLSEGAGGWTEAAVLREVNTALPQHRLRHLHAVTRLPLGPRGKPGAAPGCDGQGSSDRRWPR
jgi:non-ribosomal peptide synthetase component F